MLKLTRKRGLGVLLVLLMIAIVIDIVKGDFFFHDQGRGVSLLIVLGMGIFSAIVWNMAAKINVSDNAQGAQKETKGLPRRDVKVAQKSYIHS